MTTRPSCGEVTVFSPSGVGLQQLLQPCPVGETGGSKGKGDGRGGESPARRAAACGSAQA
jgi:hypothetical protein